MSTDVPQSIDFVVYGSPVTQGSKKTVPIRRKDGSPVMKDGRPLTRVAPDNPKLGQWRQQVAEVARSIYHREPLLGPIRLVLTFERPRPNGHFGTGRNAGNIKDSAPDFPTTRPDTLKLARAIEDALTGIIWRDDSQIVEHDLRKVWGSSHTVSVHVEPIPEKEAA